MSLTTKILRGLAYTIMVGATAYGISGCSVGVGAEYADDGVDEPPDAYIGTVEPVYYEGHASYYYGNRWYYRDGDHWHHYDHEPAELHEHRSGAQPRRRTYEPAAPRRPASSPVRRGGGPRGGPQRGSGGQRHH